MTYSNWEQRQLDIESGEALDRAAEARAKREAKLLEEANALDEAYARADAFDKAHGPTRTVWCINWDNGNDACGTFPWEFETEEEAQAAAEDWVLEACADWGIDPESDEAPTAEAIAVEVPVDPDAEVNRGLPSDPEACDEMGELRKAALNRGQP